MEEKLTVRDAEQRHKQGLLTTWVLIIRHVILRHELIWQLFVRDFFVMNKRSFLGSSWLFIAPIFGMISWLFLNMAGLLDPGEIQGPYILYLLNGTLLWGCFVNIMLQAKDTLSITMSYVAQVNFPHEVVLIKQIMQAMANTMFGFVINVVIMIVFGYPPSWWAVFMPLLMLPAIFLAAGIGVIFSVVRVVFPDSDRVLNQVFPLLMYTAPIIYSGSVTNQKLAMIIKYNPLTYIIGLPRDVIMRGPEGQPWSEFFWCGLAAFLFFLIALRIFYVSEEIVIERLY